MSDIDFHLVRGLVAVICTQKNPVIGRGIIKYTLMHISAYFGRGRCSLRDSMAISVRCSRPSINSSFHASFWIDARLDQRHNFCDSISLPSYALLFITCCYICSRSTSSLASPPPSRGFDQKFCIKTRSSFFLSFFLF